MPRRETRIGDDAVKKRTGRTWQEWFSLLDAWGARERGHQATARHLHGEHGLSGWWSQMVTVEYERSRGLREVGQRGDEYRVAVQRTVEASPEAVFAAWTDPSLLARWFTKRAVVDPRAGGRYATSDGDRGRFLRVEPPTRLRFTWDHPDHSPGIVVEVTIRPKEPGRSVVRVEHTRLPSRDAFVDMKEGWTGALVSLRSFVASRPSNAPP